MMLYRDPKYPALPLLPLVDGTLRTRQDLYLARVLELRAATSRTIPLSVEVLRASDGASTTYVHVISTMRRRRDGTPVYRVTARGVGAWPTVTEAVQGILAHAAARFEGEQTWRVQLHNPATGPRTVALRAGGV